MEKAIEIKRRAQRCIQNGDLEGALTEYEKLVGAPDSDPYNYVLLADLLYKKGDHDDAAERYLSAVHSYQNASLYKNAIAVCKKMVRLSLSPAKVLQSLATLHALDGLAGEAALYYVQYAEHLVRAGVPADAARALRQAFDLCQDNVRVLEQLSEAWLLAGENGPAAQALMEAAAHYRHTGADGDADRCEQRAAQLDANAEAPEITLATATAVAEPGMHLPEPGAVDLGHEAEAPSTNGAAAGESVSERMDGFETGRHHASVPGADVEESDEVEAAEQAPAYAPLPMGEPGLHEPVDTGMEETEAAREYEIPEDALDEAPVFEIADEDAEPSEDAYEIPEVTEELSPVYEIADATPTPAAGGARDLAVAETEAVADVYEIEADDVGATAEAIAKLDDGPSADEHVYEIEAEPVAEAAVTPGAPSLAFHDEAAEPPPPPPSPEDRALTQVEELLVRAQDQYRTGERDEASMTLALAAQVCESIGRLENAATIYRSLGRGPHATPAMLQMWMTNCERRGDMREAGQVACELGDRALNDGDEAAARGWFERATTFDPANETALRRQHRLEQLTPGEAEPAAVASPAPIADPAATGSGEGRVEVAVGRAEAVSFDLEGLLAEFQRGVEAQLAGDPQSHYDLGMTYREMGLLDQATESFKCAARDARFAARSMEMIGRCLAEQGRSKDAVIEFQRALSQPGVTAGNDLELRYHLGLALENTGRADEALVEFERVQSQMPAFEDVEERVAAMRRWLGRA